MDNRYRSVLEASRGFHRGQKYSLSIARTTTKPPKPAGLSAEGGLNMATLRWTDPGYSSSIAKQQYRQKEGAGAWGAWTDIPNSGPGRANAASYTVDRPEGRGDLRLPGPRGKRRRRRPGVGPGDSDDADQRLDRDADGG